jgi:hypothetical protein
MRVLEDADPPFIKCASCSNSEQKLGDSNYQASGEETRVKVKGKISAALRSPKAKGPAY